VVDDSSDGQLEWKFFNDNGPFEACGRYFVQDTRPNVDDIKVFPHFGLLDDSAQRWSTFWGNIDQINKAANGKAVYKVFFLGRHGEAYNDIKVQAEKSDDVGDLKRDPSLTQLGCLDAMNAHAAWEEEKIAQIGLPNISYCSPLSRALLTNTLTFGAGVYHDSSLQPDLETIIVENCREQCSRGGGEHRRSKLFIGDIFPKFIFEDGFEDDDHLWPTEETRKEVRGRVRQVLAKIFSTEGIFVSITAHYGFIQSFLRVVERGPYSSPTGVVLPLVVKYTPPKK